MIVKLKSLELINFKGKDIKGLRFSRLTVLYLAGCDQSRTVYWVCICDCGVETVARGTSLRSGAIKSCGCLRKERLDKSITTHGLTGGRNHTLRLYRIWRNMKSRCFNPKTPKYKNHGGRGITICPEWMDYKPFHNWAIANGYQDDLTIERIDNDGDYCPENCKWATYKEQSLNSRQNHIISYKGKSKTLKEWADSMKIKYSTLRARLIQYGWPIDLALVTPISRQNRKDNLLCKSN